MRKNGAAGANGFPRMGSEMISPQRGQLGNQMLMAPGYNRNL